MNCPICSRQNVMTDTCPQCAANLRPLVRIQALQVEAHQAETRKARTRRLGAVFSAFAFGLGVLGTLGFESIHHATPEPLRTEVPAKHVEAPPPQEAAAPPVSYRVRAGDSLWSIAKQKYGTAIVWNRIREANKIAESQLGRLSPGDEIVLPAITLRPE